VLDVPDTNAEEFLTSTSLSVIVALSLLSSKPL
jgi:hypothetical protein